MKTKTQKWMIYLLFVGLIGVLAGCDAPVSNPESASLPSPYYQATNGMPQYFAHPDGCDAGIWVAGSVTDFSGAAIEFLLVRLTAPIGIEDSFTGVAPQYGPGGFEIQVTADLAESASNLLQLMNIDGDQPIAASDFVGFKTYTDCDKNLIIIDFEQIN